MDDKSIKEFEEELQFEDDTPEFPPIDIVSYNELRSAADLFRMYDQNILDIQPEFQREIVWTPAFQTRFIDSLIKQFPIPSMCFAYDYKREKWYVVDGLQRISSIIRFLSDDEWKLSNLDDIEDDISNKKIIDIKNDRKLSKYYSRVENLTMPVTVLRCDYSNPKHTAYLFKIFHRLNTGGMKLNNQEIRNCIYFGPFNKLLKKLNMNANWRNLNKIKPNHSYRFTKEELILRFFALLNNYKNYGGRLAKFLNDYMENNKNLSDEKEIELTRIFEETMEIVYRKVFEQKVPAKLTNTILESVLVGVASNIELIKQQKISVLKEKYTTLLQEPSFSEIALKEDLSNKQKLINRIEAGIRVFSE